jgi:hypothetical protein
MKWVDSIILVMVSPIPTRFLTVDHPSVFPLFPPCKSGTSAPDRPAAINPISLLIPPSRIRGSPFFVGLDHEFLLDYLGAMRWTIDSLDLDSSPSIGVLLTPVIHSLIAACSQLSFLIPLFSRDGSVRC